MTELEKLLKGLECCSMQHGNCGECPYYDPMMGMFDSDCKLQMQDDALAVLRKQMPRVMTLEEAREAIRDGGEDVIFWEEKMSYNPHRLSIGLRIPEEFTFAEGDYAEFDVLDDPEVAPGYGSLFRLWTSRPTPEQMREMKWEGEEDHEA